MFLNDFGEDSLEVDKPRGKTIVPQQESLTAAVQLMNRKRHMIAREWLVQELEPLFGKRIEKFVDDREKLDKELVKVNMRLTVKCQGFLGVEIGKAFVGPIKMKRWEALGFEGKPHGKKVRMDTFKLWANGLPVQALVLIYYYVFEGNEEIGEIHWEKFRIVKKDSGKLVRMRK